MRVAASSESLTAVAILHLNKCRTSRGTSFDDGVSHRRCLFPLRYPYR